MISTTINFDSSSLKTYVDHMEPISVHPGWVWNEEALFKFESNLRLPYYRERFEALVNLEGLTPSQRANEVKRLLLENTKTSNIKEKKKMKDDQNSEPWFDSECKKLKNSIRLTGN